MKNRILVLALVAAALSACSMLPGAVDAAEEAATTAMVQSAERTICRNIPVGTWRRLYGSNPVRAQAWRELCANPVEIPAGG